MARQLRAKYGREKIAEIVKAKREWDNDLRPLVDGSLTAAGPFDRKTDTIATASKASARWRDQMFLHSLTLWMNPRQVIELGTNVGISSAYIASALKACGPGRIHTIDASPYRIRLARQLHSKLKLDNVDYTVGVFADVLNSAVGSIAPIDMAFVDGQPDHKATIDFFDLLSGKTTPGAVLLINNIAHSESMKKAWTRLQNDRRTFAATEIGNIGVITIISQTFDS